LFNDNSRYEKEGYWKSFKSVDHCVDECLTKKVLDECNCIFNQSRSGRITKWIRGSNEKFCKEYDLKGEDFPEKHIKPKNCSHRDNYEAHNTICGIQGVCNYNCMEEFYKYEVKEMFFDEDEDGRNSTEEEDEYRTGLPLFTKFRANETGATVNVIRKDMADVTYEHTAEMIFVEFVCYFGGLLGLWLGVSILDMYHQCLIWWKEVPVEYKKWLERQKISTNVERFSAGNRDISVISKNYSSGDNYNANIGSLYNTKY